ncbi:esterase-like [Malania oleifera]|uniref:esterase-like n=1 Tax=Malania oleifera TaxID=397392 RepID=UPI0025AE2C8D|nr:esterase-like [Malania oleifera]
MEWWYYHWCSRSSNIKINAAVFVLCNLYLLSSCASAIAPQPAAAAGNYYCKFPAIFNLGDSNSDTGGLSASSLSVPTPPYGQTFFRMPAGRFSDGRLVIDFIAKDFGLPFLSAYLDSMGTNFTHGANFATAAATIREPVNILPRGGFSPFDLDIQFAQFMQLKSRAPFIRKQGGVFKELMPEQKSFYKALYTFDIGQNDLGEGFFLNMSTDQVKASVPAMLTTFTTNVKKIYKKGGRSFWIHNTGPLGCLPYIFTNLPVTETDGAGCAKAYNEVAQYFNLRLKEAVAQLRKDRPSAAFTYVDVYSVKYSLYTDPHKYGFEQPLVACCGYGGKYNYGSGFCGDTITTGNGTRIKVGSCKDPSVRVNWDGIHYTEAANKFVFDHISTGAFSDPPLPLRLACRR